MLPNINYSWYQSSIVDTKLKCPSVQLAKFPAHETINLNRVNLGFTGTTKELFQLTQPIGTLLMKFKPFSSTLYFTFPKFVPRNQLQIGHKIDDTDCRKERNSIINILQFIYDSQTKIYNWTVNFVNAGVWLSNSFLSYLPPILKKKVTISYSLLKL